ncbi:MAG: DUF2066 domain-containing protein [Pseudomonadota bacterium]
MRTVGRLTACWATVVAIAAFALAPVAQAAFVNDLYTAQVPLVDRSDEAQQEAVRAALALVLVRVTGQRGIGSNPDLIVALEEADRLVQQSLFTRDGGMRVTFDGPAVERLAVSVGLPVWGQDRPATLVWLALDNGGGDRRLVAADDEDELLAVFREAAVERGIALVWPLMDSEDREALGFADVWGNFQDRIESASERYGTDAVLIGRAAVGIGGYSVRWKLAISEISETWQSSLADGVHRTADLYARYLTVDESGGGASVAVVIDGIDSLRAYALVMRHLEQLTLIDVLDVHEVVGSTVTFKLALRDHPAKLVRAISLGAPLRPRAGTSVANVTSGSTLRYDYVE